VNDALESLQALAGDDDVEGHRAGRVTVDQIGVDVEGHGPRWSDENLKEAIESLSNARDRLKAMEATPRN
jgi:hypothetical protein